MLFQSEDEEKATEITTSTPELPYGFEENDYEIIVIVHVKNKYGIQTDVTMTVKVSRICLKALMVKRACVVRLWRPVV